MLKEEINANFNKVAASYDKQWERLAPINDCLHLLMAAIMGKLPEDAKILCVGAGTGAEIIYLAKRFPKWRFMAVDPSSAMLDVCRRRLSEQGLDKRCTFHADYLDSLSTTEVYDAATSILVSQFISDRSARIDFFRQIALRLTPGGLLVSVDLSATLDTPEFRSILRVWSELMREGGASSPDLEAMRNTYANDVAVLPPEETAAIIASGGFEQPTPFHQVALIRGWYAVKKS